jgi:hypothetical protein
MIIICDTSPNKAIPELFKETIKITPKLTFLNKKSHLMSKDTLAPKLSINFLTKPLISMIPSNLLPM